MKTTELFEIKTAGLRPVKRYWKRGEDGQSVHVPDGYETLEKNYSDPRWARPSGKEITKDGRGAVYGTVGDWMKLMGATREDLAPALKLVRGSKEYSELVSLGWQEVPNSAMEKNGTIHFQTIKGYLIGDEHEKDADLKTLDRRVLANGTIRGMSYPGSYHGWRISVQEPMTMKTHPNLSPAERIAGSMRASIALLARMYQKELDDALKARLLKGKK